MCGGEKSITTKQFQAGTPISLLLGEITRIEETIDSLMQLKKHTTDNTEKCQKIEGCIGKVAAIKEAKVIELFDLAVMLD